MTPTAAYDLEILPHRVPAEGPRGQGWCFGLPPGIAASQWPRDPHNGFPLQHGFTLLLPPDYRCHGPEIVALSFFGTAFDHNDGGPTVNRPLAEMLRAEAPPEDPALAALHAAMRAVHPRCHRMRDILGCDYAVVLLTQAEFDGPFCPPPQDPAPPATPKVKPPAWLATGAAWAFWDMGRPGARDDSPASAYRRGLIGPDPLPEVGENRAIAWSPRARDPNAGRPPREYFGQTPPEGAYVPHFYWQDGVVEEANYRVHDWAESHRPCHIGGTMRQVQGVPEGFGPVYIGFEEYFGGWNFGGGNAQLDFGTMRFDWACG